MPWRHTSPLDQTPPFITADLRDRLSITARCQLYQVSRQTSPTWINRYRKDGPAGLNERSRQPNAGPRQPPAAVVAAIIAARRDHPTWGATTRLALLTQHHPSWPWPARSTVCDSLSRNGLVSRTRRRRLMGHPGKPATTMRPPTQLWTADLKGHCNTGHGRYGSPLTGVDGDSRFLLAGQALPSTAVHEAKPGFTRVVPACGLPSRLRPDHGIPFATHSLARLSPISAWWVRRGILPESIPPGHPRHHTAASGQPPRAPAPLHSLP